MLDAITPARLRLGVFALWLLACTVLLFICRNHISALTLWDPDDSLRLQEVRDWLGGQSFFDVTQYRIDPPEGVAMHWSRIVDLPIALLILLFQPLFGAPVAERIAASAIPLLIFGGSLSALALTTARLADRRAALVAVLLAATSPLLLFHVMPLRIDHHGLQTMLGLFAIAASFDTRARRGGLIAGALAATWLAISLEAMPMVTALSTLLGLRFVIERDGGEAAVRFGAFTAALAGAGILLFVGFHGRAAYGLFYCDAVSPSWFGLLMLAPALVALGMPLVKHRGVAARIALLAAAGGAGVAMVAATAPACLHGPFADLDPLVRTYWYGNVLEGLPVWKQPADNAMLTLGFPPIGFVGATWAWRRATGRAKRDWLMMLGLLIASFTLALFVQRTGGFAQACAVPGAAWLVAGVLQRVGRSNRPLVRVLGSSLAISALSPIGALTVGNQILAHTRPARGNESGPPKTCFAPCSDYDVLIRMPPAYILGGLDLTPSFLITTPHSYAGSGHHRGHDGIHRVIAAFIGTPEVAHRIMAERGITHVLIDPNGAEAETYIGAAPNGFMALLAKGKAPAWLEPVPMGKSKLRLWRRIG